MNTYSILNICEKNNLNVLSISKVLSLGKRKQVFLTRKKYANKNVCVMILDDSWQCNN